MASLDVFTALFNEALFSEISSGQDECDEDKTCPISGVKLTEENEIPLECGHKFSAIDIFNEVFRQKKSPPSTETQKLRRNEIKCPLCRHVQPRLLTPHPLCPKVTGVNHPPKLCSFPNICSHVFRSGKRKGERCDRGCLGKYCNTHMKAKASGGAQCKHVISRGPNKGKQCSVKATCGEFCKRHAKS